MTRHLMGCRPVAHGPAFVEGSTTKRCIVCDDEVWISPAGLLAAEAVGADFACMEPCARVTAQDRALELAVSSAMLDEASAVLGRELDPGEALGKAIASLRRRGAAS